MTTPSRAPDPSDADPDDQEAFRARFFTPLTHRGRTVRVLVAMALSVPGFLPIPYLGWAFGIVFFAPAAVLLAFAGLDEKSRRGVIYCSIPTIIGLGLALWSLVVISSDQAARWHFLMALGIATVASLFVALVGSPPHGR